ncbi:dihydroorotate dehydrogenase (quinone) [Putridiphycobacter roseus]|uniref:Dihydroorotate dehydrogenase (quinone) n=1 Tax=Putridiphycobacter roseus TaxID=2219161 RepID=A0A2W1N9N1_9FLAO|nr:quinone-dependent dihydroorotate dehydrogenase [Putridiphycobacter roseus]PZE15975.1 dihydroorotate dehydrogenase (quinone) [Putridiphycobacter roseus]
MYKAIIRPILFAFDPEKIHHFTFGFIKFVHKIPFVSSILSRVYTVKDKKLEQNLFGLNFKNPVGLAAGFDKNGELFNELSAFGFGFIEVGTVTPVAQEGNPKKRLFRLKEDRGLINRMGFNNKGVDALVERLKNRKTDTIIGGNIGKNTQSDSDQYIEDYKQTFEKLHDVVDYFVVNISCPNVGSMAKLQDKDFILELLNALQAINHSKKKQKPILLKIAPDLNDQQLDEIIEVVLAAKIQGVIASNTSTNRADLKMSEAELDKIGNGGLSGQPVKDRSTKVIAYLAKNSNHAFPIIGVGGIHSAKDAIEKIKAGASLVQVYTGFIYEGPKLVKSINKEIAKLNLLHTK